MDKRAVVGSTWLLLGCLITAPAFAVYRCTDADGKVTYSQVMCSPEAEDVHLHDDHSNSDDRYWQSDGCQISLKDVPVNDPVSFNLTATLWVTKTLDGPVASLDLNQLEALPLDQSAPKGVGVWVGGQNFFQVQAIPTNHSAVFSIPETLRLVEALKNGHELKTRLNFFPYERLFNGWEKEYRGFWDAYRSLNDCHPAQ